MSLTAILSEPQEHPINDDIYRISVDVSYMDGETTIAQRTFDTTAARSSQESQDAVPLAIASQVRMYQDELERQSADTTALKTAIEAQLAGG